jgi:hypothetical protein
VARDDAKRHYHLTPRGWIAGTEWCFDKGQKQERPRPEDAVATFESVIYQRFFWSKEQRLWREIWRKVEVQDSEITSLFEQFRMPGEYGNVLLE